MTNPIIDCPDCGQDIEVDIGSDLEPVLGKEYPYKCGNCGRETIFMSLEVIRGDDFIEYIKGNL